jgi:uncharacterized protein
VETQTFTDGTWKVGVEGESRAALRRFIDSEFLVAETSPVEELRTDAAETISLFQAVAEAFPSYANLKASVPETLRRRLPLIREPNILADTVAPLLVIGRDRKQELLETADVLARLERILDLIAADRRAG